MQWLTVNGACHKQALSSCAEVTAQGQLASKGFLDMPVVYRPCIITYSIANILEMREDS